MCRTVPPSRCRMPPGQATPPLCERTALMQTSPQAPVRGAPVREGFFFDIRLYRWPTSSHRGRRGGTARRSQSLTQVPAGGATGQDHLTVTTMMPTEASSLSLPAPGARVSLGSHTRREDTGVTSAAPLLGKVRREACPSADLEQQLPPTFLPLCLGSPCASSLGSTMNGLCPGLGSGETGSHTPHNQTGREACRTRGWTSAAASLLNGNLPLQG